MEHTGRRRRARRSIIGVLAVLVAVLVPAPAPAAEFVANEQPNAGSPALWVDGSGRTYAAWISGAKTDSDRDRLEIVRVLPDGTADPGFPRKSVLLGEPDQNGTGGCQGPGFTAGGSIVVSCYSLTPDEEPNPFPDDWIVMETWTVNGTKSSRRFVELEAYTDYKLLLGGTADGRIAELDSTGRLILVNGGGAVTTTNIGVADPGQYFVDMRQMAGGPLYLMLSDFSPQGRIVRIGGSSQAIDCGAGRRLDAVLPGTSSAWGYSCASVNDADVQVHYRGAENWSRVVPDCNGFGSGATSNNGNLIVACNTLTGRFQLALVPKTGPILWSGDVGTSVGPQLAFVDDQRIAVAGHRVLTSTTGKVYVDVTSFSASVPAKPDAPFAVAGDGQVKLTWTAPDNGGSPITGYRIVPIRNGVAQPAVTVGNVLTHTLTGLTNGASYRFTVAAINSVGTGPASDPSNTVVPGGLPGPPTDVRAVPGKNQGTVSWKPPASTGGTPITGYKVTVIATGVALQRILAGNVTSVVVPGLGRRVTYTFTVAAITAVGTGPDSAVSNPIFPAAVP